MDANSLASIVIRFDGEADDELSEAVKVQIETHCNVTLVDVVKFLYQSTLGSFHLLDHMTEGEIETWIRKNLAAAQPKKEPLTEKLCGAKWVRINLGAFKQKHGNDYKLLTNLFMKGSDEKRTPKTGFSTELDSLLKLIVTEKIKPLDPDFNLPDLAVDFLTDYKRRGFPPLHHSPLYNEKNPQYIVISLDSLFNILL